MREAWQRPILAIGELCDASQDKYDVQFNQSTDKI